MRASGGASSSLLEQGRGGAWGCSCKGATGAGRWRSGMAEAEPDGEAASLARAPGPPELAELGDELLAGKGSEERGTAASSGSCGRRAEVQERWRSGGAGEVGAAAQLDGDKAAEGRGQEVKKTAQRRDDGDGRRRWARRPERRRSGRGRRGVREEIEGRWGSSEELSLLSGGASRGRRWGSRRGRWRREGSGEKRGRGSRASGARVRSDRWGAGWAWEAGPVERKNGRGLVG